MKKSDFRKWVEEIWRENQEERIVWRDATETLQAYVQRYKWWLKREYRYQRSK